MLTALALGQAASVGRRSVSFASPCSAMRLSAPVVVAREDFCGDDVEALVSLVLEGLGVSEAVFGAFENSMPCQRPRDLNRIEASTEFALPNRILDHPNPIVAVTFPPSETNER